MTEFDMERNPIDTDALRAVVERELDRQGVLRRGEVHDGMIYIGHLDGPEGCFTTATIWPATLPSVYVLELVSNFLTGAVESGMLDDLDEAGRLAAQVAASSLALTANVTRLAHAEGGSDE